MSKELKPRFYRPRTVSELLQVSKSKVQSWIKEGRLPAIKLEGTVLIPVDAFEKFLEDNLKPWEPKKEG